jgi:hypothetical protein
MLKNKIAEGTLEMAPKLYSYSYILGSNCLSATCSFVEKTFAITSTWYLNFGTGSSRRRSWMFRDSRLLEFKKKKDTEICNIRFCLNELHLTLLSMSKAKNEQNNFKFLF